MISQEQMERCLSEFKAALGPAIAHARGAEHALENAQYRQGPYGYDRQKTIDAAREYADADYMAESRAWIIKLISEALAKQPQPMPDLLAVHDKTIAVLNNWVKDFQKDGAS